MVNKLYDESTSKDNRIMELEEKLDRIKAELINVQKKFNYVSISKPKTEAASDIETNPSPMKNSKMPTN